MSKQGHSMKALLAQHPKIMGMAYVALLYVGGSGGEFVMNNIAGSRVGP